MGIGKTCAEITKAALAREKKAGPDTENTLDAIQLHMRLCANHGKYEATYEVFDPEMCSLVCDAIKEWDGCSIKHSNGVITISWRK